MSGQLLVRCADTQQPETSYFMMQLTKLQSRPIIPNPSCVYVSANIRGVV